jgi:molybdopterin molybdotransferase
VLTFEQALGRLLQDVRPLQAERVPIAHASGRVLARGLDAPGDLPAFDYSAMDGYALCAADLGPEGPFTLPVRAESRAGRAAPALERGSACRILTGAEIPAGADAVVVQEKVERDGDRITFAKAPRPGAHIRRRGEDARSGASMIAAGTRLRPGHLGLAASLDAAHLWVARCPQVVIVSTGDELRHPGDRCSPASIPESVSVAVAAMARQAAARVRVAPFARDDPEQTAVVLSEAIAGADVLVTVGGVSVGDHDVVRPALEAAGVQIDFWRVRVKPGKPVAVGRVRATRVLGLPGNPTSAQVSFTLFGMPLLRALQGDANPVPRRMRAVLEAPADRDQHRLGMQRGVLGSRDSRLLVRPVANQASGATTSMAEADCLLFVPPGEGAIAPGDEVEVIRLADA